MEMTFNDVVAKLITDNKREMRGEDYDKAYIDGILDFFNLVVKEKFKIVVEKK